ncbi:MAG: hypothetical protein JSW46_05510 [Gemmatimonadota bacterium]|nr:MAG: hypothetical protein JSW46_05510 [Gemmatimonadota bacterium]
MSTHGLRFLAVCVFAALPALPAPAGAQYETTCYVTFWGRGPEYTREVCVDTDRIPELLELASTRLHAYVTGSIDAYQEGTAIGFGAFQQWYDQGGWDELQVVLGSRVVEESEGETRFVRAVVSGLNAAADTALRIQSEIYETRHMRQCAIHGLVWLYDRIDLGSYSGSSRIERLQMMAPDIDAYLARFDAVLDSVLREGLVRDALQFEFVAAAAHEDSGLRSGIELAMWFTVALPPPGERTVGYFATHTLAKLILALAESDTQVDEWRDPRSRTEAYYEAIRVLYPDNVGLRCGVWVASPRSIWRQECRAGMWTLTQVSPPSGMPPRFEPLR